MFLFLHLSLNWFCTVYESVCRELLRSTSHLSSILKTWLLFDLWTSKYIVLPFVNQAHAQPLMKKEHISFQLQNNWTLAFHTPLVLKGSSSCSVMDSTVWKTQFKINYTFTELLNWTCTKGPWPESFWAYVYLTSGFSFISMSKYLFFTLCRM